MARTKGAKDSRQRKKPAGSPSKQTSRSAAGIPPIDRPPLPPDEFKAAIAAELASADPTGSSLSEPGPTAAQPAAPAPFDPNALTLEGLTHAWQVPFWALGHVLRILRVIPSADCVIEVGKRRAGELAKPSYAIYEHYTRQYLGLHPENQVHVAAGVTGLNAAGILPDIVEAVIEARRRAAAAPARATPPGTT
jgi:hypothetical protein